MKIKHDYILQKIADEYLVVPIGEEADRLHGVIRLNETGAFLWGLFADGVKTISEIETMMMNEYGIEQRRAHHDIKIFVDQLESLSCFED